MGVGVGSDQLCLLLDSKRKYIFCVCGSAFQIATRAMFSTKRLRENIGRLVICEDGKVREITDIKKMELCGNTIWGKMKNLLLFGEYRISTKFKERSDLILEDVKNILKDYILKNEFAYEYFVINPDENYAKKLLLSEIEKVDNFADLVRVFRCKKGECLETL